MVGNEGVQRLGRRHYAELGRSYQVSAEGDRAIRHAIGRRVTPEAEAAAEALVADILGPVPTQTTGRKRR